MKDTIEGRRLRIGFLVVGAMAVAGMSLSAAPAHAEPRPGGAGSTNGTMNSDRAAPDDVGSGDQVTLRWTTSSVSSVSSEEAGATGGPASGATGGATGGVHRVVVVKRSGERIPLPDVPEGCTASRIENGVRIVCESPAVPAGEKSPTSVSISVTDADATDADATDAGSSKDARVRAARVKAAREVAQEVAQILAGSVARSSADSLGESRAPESGESR